MSVIIRPAETGDVRAIRALVDGFAGDGPRMLKKSMVTLYEDVQEFVVAVDGSAGRGGGGAGAESGSGG